MLKKLEILFKGWDIKINVSSPDEIKYYIEIIIPELSEYNKIIRKINTILKVEYSGYEIFNDFDIIYVQAVKKKSINLLYE